MRLNILIISLFTTLWCGAQSHTDSGKYWVFLTDKKDVTFDPHSYFHPKAIERRVRNGLPLCDSTDFPLNPEYVATITRQVDSVKTTLRWINAAVVYASTDQVKEIEALPFVKQIIPFSRAELLVANTNDDIPVEKLSTEDKRLLRLQTKRMGGEVFAEKGYTGKGVRVAIFDTGFPNADEHPAFDHIRDENRLIATYDFVRNNEDVYHSNSHGLATFSCVGGRYDNDTKVGLATGATFMLARTERARREPFSEEENWMKAAEWADKNGADIISSSLGYSNKRYFYEDMDASSFIAEAAKTAYGKGILIVNSMGNEATNNWKFLITPADADEVLSVGGIDPETGYHTSFSSFGPTADYRRKPNVTALGHVIAASPGGFSKTQGTSFSCPLVAGFAACLLEKNPEYSVQQLFEAIEQSGDLYPYFDYAHGYGVPQTSAIFYMKRPAQTFTITEKTDYVSIDVKSSYVDMAQEMVENESRFGYQQYLYYHIENSKGYLSDYFVILPEHKPIIISKLQYPDARVIRVHFHGYTEEITLEK